MKCPYCMITFNNWGARVLLGEEDHGALRWYCVEGNCLSCKKLIVWLQSTSEPFSTTSPTSMQTLDMLIDGASDECSDAETILVKPKSSFRPCPPEVPKQIAEDYTEACLVLADSPKASAALSRRCLQAVLRAAGFTQYNLSDQIEEAIKQLPPHLAQQVDAIRNIGNFATHPKKSQSTGEIMPVEPGEAEWNLDILEALFEFYYVQPAMIQKKRQALDKKLKDIGQKPMK